MNTGNLDAGCSLPAAGRDAGCVGVGYGLGSNSL